MADLDVQTTTYAPQKIEILIQHRASIDHLPSRCDFQKVLTSYLLEAEYRFGLRQNNSQALIRGTEPSISHLRGREFNFKCLDDKLNLIPTILSCSVEYHFLGWSDLSTVPELRNARSATHVSELKEWIHTVGQEEFWRQRPFLIGDTQPKAKLIDVSVKQEKQWQRLKNMISKSRDQQPVVVAESGWSGGVLRLAPYEASWTLRHSVLKAKNPQLSQVMRSCWEVMNQSFSQHAQPKVVVACSHLMTGLDLIRGLAANPRFQIQLLPDPYVAGWNPTIDTLRFLASSDDRPRAFIVFDSLQVVDILTTGGSQ